MTGIVDNNKEKKIMSKNSNSSNDIKIENSTSSSIIAPGNKIR
jgi:hypothetical protein